MKTVLVTGPTKKPLDIMNVKDQLRIDYDDDSEETYLERLIATATERVENLCGRKLITQTWKAYYDDWPFEDRFEIPFGQLQSITHLKYTDTDDSTSTWSTTNYKVDTYDDPGHLVLGYNKSWPTVTLQVANPIEIQFVCGYGDDEEDVPEQLRHAMKLLVTHWYENREGWLSIPGMSVYLETPEALYALIEDYRIRGFHW